MKTSWDLTEFYNSLQDEQLVIDINIMVQKTTDFASTYKTKITSLDSKMMVEFLKNHAVLYAELEKPYLYLMYQETLNTQSQEVKKLFGMCKSQYVDSMVLLQFIDQELKEIGDEKLQYFAQELSQYENFFDETKRANRYLLDEKVEQALSIASKSGSTVLLQVYSELTGSFAFTLEGEAEELNDPHVRALRQHADREVRKKALAAISKVYGGKQTQIVLSQVYTGVVKNWVEKAKLRGYPSTIAIRNQSEQMDDGVIDTLLSAVTKKYSLVGRYAQLKAKHFGTEKLHENDMYAPVGETQKKFSLEESLDLFLDVLQPFDAESADIVRRLFDEGCVDVFPSKNKRGGAYCSFVDAYKTRVLLNHTGSSRDVATLAHEFGHAIHGELAKIQPMQVQYSSLCLAETASIFMETLLSKHLLNTFTTKEEKISYLFTLISELASTIFQQIQYISFEKRIHDGVWAGEEFSYEDYNAIWREEKEKLWDNQMEWNADTVNVTWSTIPHIFRTPFYCYTYSFGALLSLSLYKKYEEEGEVFVQDYKEILKAGGSKRPLDLLKKYGIDISSEQFFLDGISVFEGYINELEELLQ